MREARSISHALYKSASQREESKINKCYLACGKSCSQILWDVNVAIMLRSHRWRIDKQTRPDLVRHFPYLGTTQCVHWWWWDPRAQSHSCDRLSNAIPIWYRFHLRFIHKGNSKARWNPADEYESCVVLMWCILPCARPLLRQNYQAQGVFFNKKLRGVDWQLSPDQPLLTNICGNQEPPPENVQAEDSFSTVR